MVAYLWASSSSFFVVFHEVYGHHLRKNCSNISLGLKSPTNVGHFIVGDLFCSISSLFVHQASRGEDCRGLIIRVKQLKGLEVCSLLLYI